jgi:hypothetical protein
MLNNFVLKASKSAKNFNNIALKNFSASGSMTARFHDIYIKELEKLEKNK